MKETPSEELIQERRRTMAAKKILMIVGDYIEDYEAMYPLSCRL